MRNKFFNSICPPPSGGLDTTVLTADLRALQEEKKGIQA